MATTVHPGITIKLDRNGKVYQPGELLSGQYWLEGISRRQIEAVEISVGWATEGKGETDIGICYTQRLSIDEGHWIDPRHPGRFCARLPKGPLSYDGQIIKLRWFVWVRVYLTNGRIVTEALPFRLGSAHFPDAENGSA